MRNSTTLNQTLTANVEALPVQIARRQPEGDTALTSEASASPMLCCYQNQTPKIQIIRSVYQQQGPDWQLERVVFPGQRLLFEAPQHSKLHVFSSQPVGTLVDDTVPCNRLQVKAD